MSASVPIEDAKSECPFKRRGILLFYSLHAQNSLDPNTFHLDLLHLLQPAPLNKNNLDEQNQQIHREESPGSSDARGRWCFGSKVDWFHVSKKFNPFSDA